MGIENLKKAVGLAAAFKNQTTEALAGLPSIVMHHPWNDQHQQWGLRCSQQKRIEPQPMHRRRMHATTCVQYRPFQRRHSLDDQVRTHDDEMTTVLPLVRNNVRGSQLHATREWGNQHHRSRAWQW